MSFVPEVYKDLSPYSPETYSQPNISRGTKGVLRKLGLNLGRKSAGQGKLLLRMPLTSEIPLGNAAIKLNYIM